MQVPVVLFELISLAQFEQTANKFGISEVLVVVQVENNLVAGHLFEIEVVVNGRWLMTESGANFLCFNFEFVRLFI